MNSHYLDSVMVAVSVKCPNVIIYYAKCSANVTVTKNYDWEKQ